MISIACTILAGAVGFALGYHVSRPPYMCPKCGGLIRKAESAFAVCTRCDYFKWY